MSGCYLLPGAGTGRDLSSICMSSDCPVSGVLSHLSESVGRLRHFNHLLGLS